MKVGELRGLEVSGLIIDEHAHISAKTWATLYSGGFKMALTNEQFIEMGKAAMQALITCNDSIILTPDDVAERAWDMAEAMGKVFNVRNPAPNAAKTPIHASAGAGGSGAGGGSGSYPVYIKP